MTWSEVEKYAFGQNPAPSRWVDHTPEEWAERLTEEEFRVTRQHGTEKAFSGEYCSTHKPGRYACIGCGTPLFEARQKFDSDTGWPSFTEPLAHDVLRYRDDQTLPDSPRIEVRCNVCDAHLGHVFPDGPEPGGLRYCINSAALLLLPAGRGEPFFLQYDEAVQGTFNADARFTLLYLFRMNCPGCFLYGFDEAHAVFDAFDPEELQVVGLSTAFGEFDGDPAEATRRFVRQGVLTPVVEHEFHELNIDRRPYPVRFPVLLDRMSAPEEFLNADTLQWFYSLNPNYPLVTAEDVKSIVRRATLFYTQFPLVSHTFSLNFLRGTPSYILLDHDKNKRADWLGHQGAGPLIHKIRLLMGDK
jgi:peptide-methionine (R)-S-oxide reductase